MNLFLVFTGSFIMAFSGAIAPGPLLFYTIARSTKSGGFTGFFVIIGHMLLEFIIVIILLLGLQNLINKVILEIILLISGGFLLIIMGIMTFLPVIKKNYNNDFTITEESKKSNLSLIAGGFVMSVSNPYFLLWWLVIGAGYLFASLKLGTIGVILFFIGHILADMVWYVFISQCVSKSKKFLSGKYYLSIIIICSILIIIIGAVFFIKGIILL